MSITFAKTSFSKIEPSLIAFEIFGSIWKTVLPAPIFVCPTSEFPNCPSGSPTCPPSARSSVKGYSFLYLSKFNGFAILIPLT